MERDGMEVRVMPCMHCDIPLGGRGVPLRETGPNSACLVRGMRGAQTSWGIVYEISFGDGYECEYEGERLVKTSYEAPIAYCPACGRRLK